MCGDTVAVMDEVCSKIISDKRCTYRGSFKPNKWWNKDCLVTRDRQRFGFRTRKAYGRPLEGYKSAQKFIDQLVIKP